MNDDRFEAKIIHAELEDGRKICIRSINPSDEENMRHGIERLSTQSRYLRFFSVQPMPSDTVIEKLVDVDGHDHIAWGAILTDNGENAPMGAVHAIRDEADGSAGEFSVAIIDAYHGLGLARMLTAVIMVHCQIEGITSLDVQILSQNMAALNLVKELGGTKCGAEADLSYYRIDTGLAFNKIKKGPSFAGLRLVITALEQYFNI